MTSWRKAGPLLAGCALAISGCAHGTRATKDVSPRAAALPATELKVAVTVLDAETGKSIPDAYVLVAARVTTDREAPSGALDAVAGARSATDQDGTARIQEVEGAYYPGEPKGKTWIVMEEARAERLGPRKLTGIEGGDIVVASPIYGFIRQPFAVEDGPAFQAWLKGHGGKKGDYDGLIRKGAVRVSLPTLFVRSDDLEEKGLALTIRMRRPRDFDEWAKTISYDAFLEATWFGMSVDAGATEEEQERLYWRFGRQLDWIGIKTGKMEHAVLFSIYLRDEALRYYAGHAPHAGDQEGRIQLWLAEKALELQDSVEVKEYAQAILKGVADEGKGPAWRNHFYDPQDPARSLPGAEPAMRWAGLEQDNPRNAWDWQDAQRYYKEDKVKAYEALGHVVRLLVNLSIPKYVRMDAEKETEFEKAVLDVMAAQAGQLPPDYSPSTKEPASTKPTRGRFEDVARRTAGLTAGNLLAGLPPQTMTNETHGSPDLVLARAGFPPAIAQATGLMRDFYWIMHLPKVAGPGGGDGDGGPGQGVQASSGTLTDREEARRKAEDIFGSLKILGGKKPIVKLVEDDSGVKAVIEALDRSALDEMALVELQKIGCAAQDALAILVCGQTEGRLARSWPDRMTRTAQFYVEKLLPIITDRTAPVRMRAEYAVDIISDLTQTREAGVIKLSEDIRVRIARGMASLMVETDEGLRRWGLQGCMDFGGDVRECEDGVEAALRSPDVDFQHLAFHLLGAMSDVLMRERGLKGPLNGKRKRRILDVVYTVLSEGTPKHPEKVVATAARSVSFLGNPLIGDLSGEMPRIAELLLRLQKSDPSPLVRYRAYEGLDNLATFGAEAVQAKAKAAIDGIDPRADEIKALGGPGPFSTKFPKRNEKK